jgi:hypothetical protein
LQVQIQAYLDNVFDVGALLEDAETKNAALERVEELEENISHVTTSQKGEITFNWVQNTMNISFHGNKLKGLKSKNELLPGVESYQSHSRFFERKQLGCLKQSGIPCFASPHLPVHFA